MKKYYIDFTDAKYIGQMHLIIKKQLDFPDWYGENLDALWDLLTGYIEPGVIYITGLEKLPKKLHDYRDKILRVFERTDKCTVVTED
jgi:ribonuclease inhibitor